MIFKLKITSKNRPHKKYRPQEKNRPIILYDWDPQVHITKLKHLNSNIINFTAVWGKVIERPKCCSIVNLEFLVPGACKNTETSFSHGVNL